MEPKSEGAPKQAEKAQELTKVGFNRLGQSDIYERGPFAIGVNNGEYSFYQDVQSNLPPEAITGVKIVAPSWSTAPPRLLAVFGIDEKLGPRVSISDPGGGASTTFGEPGFRDNPDFSDISGKTIEQQLTEAGFAMDEQAAGFFQRTFGSGDNTINVVAVVEDGKLKKLIKEGPPYLRGSLYEKMPYKITGIESEQDDGQPILKAENDALTFDITPKGVAVVQSVSFKRELTPVELGITPFPETVQPDGFIIGGSNSTDTIRRLTAINGQPIVELERRMKPSTMSTAGFLGSEEQLLDVMAADNDYVQLQGLTHQDLARELRYAQELYFNAGQREFIHNGRRYNVSVNRWRGTQESPFNDGTEAGSDIKITNLDTGASLQASLLLPDMIERYGFYEGKDVSYRLDPQQIIEVFDFLKEEGQQRPQENPNS